MTTQVTSIRTEIQNTIDIIQSFGDVLEQETEALKGSNFNVIDGLQSLKRDLAAKYQTQISLLSRKKAELENIGTVLRDQLIKARTKFTLILTENLHALENMKASNQRLIEHIISAAREALNDKKEFKGQYTQYGREHVNRETPVSISLNQQL